MITIRTKKETRQQTGLEKALSSAKTSGKAGRLLVRGLKKLEEGKIYIQSLRIGLMASILMIDDGETRQALIGHWANLCKARPLL